LYRGKGDPEWVMQVPVSLAKDLKEDFVSAWQVFSYRGTMVYFGGPKSMGFFISLSTLNQDDSGKTERLDDRSPKE
jgi:hypothetical protein